MPDKHHATRRESPDAPTISVSRRDAPNAPDLPDAIAPEDLPRETAPALVSRLLELREAFQRRLKR